MTGIVDLAWWMEFFVYSLFGAFAYALIRGDLSWLVDYLLGPEPEEPLLWDQHCHVRQLEEE